MTSMGLIILWMHFRLISLNKQKMWEVRRNRKQRRDPLSLVWIFIVCHCNDLWGKCYFNRNSYLMYWKNSNLYSCKLINCFWLQLNLDWCYFNKIKYLIVSDFSGTSTDADCWSLQHDAPTSGSFTPASLWGPRLPWDGWWCSYLWLQHVTLKQTS